MSRLSPMQSWKGGLSNWKKTLINMSLDGNGTNDRMFDEWQRPLGTSSAWSCKIDSISQKAGLGFWSGAGEASRSVKPMESPTINLVTEDLGIIQLLHPPFDNLKFTPGDISKDIVPVSKRRMAGHLHPCPAIVVNLGFANRAITNVLGIYWYINPITWYRLLKEIAV